MSSLLCLSDAPGVVGDIARWIDSQLQCSQPQISLAGALSLVSALKAQRVAINGICPSLYTCVVGGSGVGKSSVQTLVTTILTQVGLTGLLMGKPASDSGLLKALQEEPRRILIWDEFGIALSEMATSKNGYRTLILSTLMDLFSTMGRPYIGKEYAAQARVDISAPYLSIFAASTPNRFFGSLSQDFIEDGFLSRWLLFFGDPESAFRDPTPAPLPAHILDQIAEIQRWEPATTGNLATILKVQCRPLKTEAPTKLDIWRKDCQAQMRRTKLESERIFWSRAYEQTLKVLLTVSTVPDFASVNDVAYAIELVQALTRNTIKACHESLHEDKRMRTKAKFCELVGASEWIPHSVLLARSNKLPLSLAEKKQIIDECVESGAWAKEFYHIGDSRKKSPCYRKISGN